MKEGAPRIPRGMSIPLLVATLGLVGWLIARDRPSLDPLMDLEPLALMVIMILQLLYLIPESYRQEIVVESSANVSIGSFTWFRIFLVGRFINTLIPQGGNVYRALRLQSGSGIAVADFGGGMAAFVIMSLVASLLLAAPFLAWQSPSLTIAGIPASVAVLLAACGIASVPFTIWGIVRRRTTAAVESSRILNTGYRVATATITALRDVRLMIRFASVWAVTIVVVVLLYRAVFEVVGWELGIGEAIAIYAMLQASSFVVLTPGNLGIQELGLAALAVLFGIPPAIGAVAAAIIRVTGWIALAVPAVALGADDIVAYLRRRQPTE